MEGMPAPIPRLEGDFSLNAANSVSADLLLRGGLDRLAPTHDLSAQQLAGLAKSLGHRAPRLEVRNGSYTLRLSSLQAECRWWHGGCK